MALIDTESIVRALGGIEAQLKRIGNLLELSGASDGGFRTLYEDFLEDGSYFGTLSMAESARIEGEREAYMERTGRKLGDDESIPGPPVEETEEDPYVSLGRPGDHFR